MSTTDPQGVFWVHPNHRDSLRNMAKVLSLLALVQLVAWLVPASPEPKAIPGYLPLHSLLETVSIVISMLVFTVGWNSHHRKQSGNIVLLACVFFAVGLLDFLHTVSYGGMPEFITPNDPQKHLYFWLSARLLGAIALLIVTIRPWRPSLSATQRILIFSGSVSLVILISWLVWFHETALPDTFIPGHGLTTFKKILEYMIIAINLATASRLWNKMRSPQRYNVVLLFGAVCTMAMSEFYFTLYTTMTGSYNVLGHIYKVIAYLLIYRAIVVEVIEDPYNKLAQVRGNLAMSLRASNTGLWDLDISTGTTYFSHEWKAQLGYLPGELANEYATWESLLHPDDRIPALHYVKDFLSSQRKNYENEFRLRHRDGSYRWILARGEMQFDSKGNALRLIGAHIDITEHKAYEHTLAINKQVLDATSDGFWLSDTQGNLQSANQAYANLSGYTLDELAHMHISQLDAQESSNAAIQAHIRKIITRGSDQFETVHRHKDGHLIDIEITTSYLPDTQQFAVFARDITERKKLEMTLATNEKEFRLLAESMPQIVWITDADGRNVYFNQQWVDYTGLSLEETSGDNWVIPFHPDDQQPSLDAWQKAVSEHGIYSVECRLRRCDGVYRWWLIRGVPVHEESGNISKWFGTCTDIHDIKIAAQEQQETSAQLERANAQIEEERARLAVRVLERTAQLQYANHAKDSFLATMSHEIRTPLGGLLGMMELLSLSRLDQEQNDILEAAQLSGKSLLRIVNDILDWSKIEAGKLELAPRNASIIEMLKGVASTYTQIASEKDIQLKFELDPSLSPGYVFDPLRLSQVINNFTSNAIKFTERGSVEISAKREAYSDGYDTVRICVKDSGVGISPEQQQRLFQHYEQATADTARLYGGTGLGLAICRSLAELMDGTLSLDSTPGVGSTFCISLRLPVAQGHNDLAAQTQLAGGGQSALDIRPLTTPGQHVAVLIVDDHPLNRMLLKQQLGLLGLQVEAAESGTPALALWQRSHFDLIITDCHMPEMDGYELTHHIRDLEQQAGTPRIPIIAWTANVLTEEEERCHIAGMDDLLTKPTELADLRAMLLKWLVKAGVLK